MSCYEEEQGSELSGIQLNRVPPERHRERSLAAGGSRKIKAKYGVARVFPLDAMTLNYKIAAYAIAHSIYNISALCVLYFMCVFFSIQIHSDHTGLNIHVIT